MLTFRQIISQESDFLSKNLKEVREQAKHISERSTFQTGNSCKGPVVGVC